MSVIQKIRDKYAAVVIAVIALSLIAFILMDAFVGRGSGMGSTSTVLGKVNGQKIDRNDFERRLKMAEASYGAQAGREQLIGNVWEQTVDEVVMDQVYDELGLTYSDKELNELLFSQNAPDWLKGQFTDPATGQYRINDAKQALANLKKNPDNPNAEYVAEAVKATRIAGLRMKYISLLTQSAYVPKWFAEKSIADQNAIASFSYVTVPYSTIPDTDVKVTDDDIEAYIKRYPEIFKQEEASRSVSYVTFNASASREDSSTVLNQISSLQGEFAATTEVENFVNRNASEMPYYDGYTLGSKMQMANAEALKGLADGQVYGPYPDGNNYVLAKMIDRRMMPDSVKVRHILVKTGDQGQPTLADTIAKRRIDSIAAAIASGVDFNSMVQQYSEDPGSKSTGGEYEFSSAQFANLSREFAEVAFYGRPGDRKTVKVESGSYSGYHYIEVLEHKNVEQAYKIAYLAKPIVASQNTINTANSNASQFSANSRTRQQFEDNAKKQGLQVSQMMDIKQNDFSVAGLGDNRALVRWVYENNVGDVSEPFEVNEKFVVAVVTSASEEGTMSVAKARASAEPQIINEKKAQKIIATKLKGGASLDEVARAAGQPVLRADSVSFAQPFIPQIGNEPRVTGAAFNKSLQGKVSQPIAGNTGVFVIRGESIGAQANTGTSADDLRRQMEMQYKQMSGYRSVEALRKAAKVKDNRFDFY